MVVSTAPPPSPVVPLPQVDTDPRPWVSSPPHASSPGSTGLSAGRDLLPGCGPASSLAGHPTGPTAIGNEDPPVSRRPAKECFTVQQGQASGTPTRKTTPERTTP